MFTPGQAARMRAALTSGVAGRNNLWTTTNLNATGATSAPLCSAEFYSDKQTVCAGDQIDFIDDSYHNVSGWTWTFTGGSPSSSTQQNPTVTYNTPGTYAVVLTATDGSSSVSKTKTGYITVLSDGMNLPILEGFETISVPDANWGVTDYNNNAFQVSGAAGATGSKSLKLSNTTSIAGDIDEFVSNNIDLSNVSDLTLSFKYAFVKKSSANTDALQILASSNCGESWSVRKNISATQLPTGTTTGSSFTPSASDWEEVIITNISSSFWVDNFRFKFKFTSGGGNNIYIDDINIYDPTVDSPGSGTSGGAVSIEENDFLTNLKLFPTPTAGNAELAFSLKSGKDVKITMTDMVGKTIDVVAAGNLASGEHRYNLPTAFLSSGIYFVNVEIDGAIMTQKLIVQ
jgi:PKD repeat protein